MMNTPDDILGETIRVTDAMRHNDRMIRTARTQREFDALMRNGERLERQSIRQMVVVPVSLAERPVRRKPVFGGRP